MKFDFSPVPPDAIACYRPFHADAARWGIYIDLEGLVDYARALCGALSRHLFVLGSIEAVLSCVLFEVFHHEFFHHIVESSATALEIVSAGCGTPKPIYRQYFEEAYKKELGEHPHHPLEEALANAYAYNSFSFVSRVKLGYLSIQTQAYQRVLHQVYEIESDGYRHAVHYAGPRRESNYVSGGAQLIAMLFASAEIDPRALLLLSQRLMPRGHTALVEKAHVPTYLVGPRPLIEQFEQWIPAPNETYTSLFWPGDSSEVDGLVRKLHRQQKGTKSTGDGAPARGAQHRATR